MPQTASLHFLTPQPAAGLRNAVLGPPDPLRVVRQAYARLGFVPAGELPVARRAVLMPAVSGEYASLYDSLEFGRDPAMLRQLAAAISKRLNTTALVVSLQDQERFEFVLYRAGRQIDSAGSDAGGNAAALTRVRGHRQASLWYEALGHHRFLAITEPAEAPDARMARFMAQAGAAANASGADSAAALAAWCQLAGLAPGLAERGYSAAPVAGAAILEFAEVARTPQPRAAKGQLAPYHAVADFPQHGFFPAPWPVPGRATSMLTWPALLEDGGASRLRLAFHMDRAGEFRLEKVSVAAFAFRNGEMLSAVPLASWGQLVPAEIGAQEADIALDADLALLAPSEGTAYLLQIRADVAAGEAGELFITPSVRADGALSPALMLPSLRVAVTRLDWVPLGADPHDPSPRRHEALLRLNAPSVHNAVAILPDTGDDVRRAAQEFMARFLQPITTTALMAVVETQRHITPEFNVAKTRQVVPMQGFLQTPLWERLFAAERGYQSVRVGVCAQDSPHVLAGMVLETSLRNERGEDLGQSRFSGPSLAVAFWVLAEEAALALLRMDMRDAGGAFSEWVRAQTVLQAWAVDCAWVPEFDRHGQFVMTPYEAAGKIDWFGENLAGMLTDRAWLRRHLRFVAPRLWLGWELAERVDARALTAIAQVTQLEDGLEILLHEKGDMALLEHLLRPVLPSAA